MYGYKEIRKWKKIKEITKWLATCGAEGLTGTCLRLATCGGLQIVLAHFLCIKQKKKH
jgi:hypothetical protein